MRYLVPVLAVLGAMGCAGGPSPEIAELRSQVEKQRAEMLTKIETGLHVYSALVDGQNGLLNRMGKLEGVVNILQSNVERLEGLVAKLEAQAGAVLPPKVDPSGAHAPEAAPPLKSIEEILIDAERSLGDLRAGRLTPAEAAGQLRPYAKDVIPIVMDEIGRSILKVEYTFRLEQMLCSFPPAELKLPLQKSLDNLSIRLHAARIVGATGDLELSKILEPHEASDDEDFRLSLCEALVRCRNPAGVPGLVRCLKSDQRDTRTIAINALRPLNQGGDFGYRPGAGAAENAGALKSWDEWTEKMGKAVFDGPGR